MQVSLRQAKRHEADLRSLLSSIEAKSYIQLHESDEDVAGSIRNAKDKFLAAVGDKKEIVAAIYAIRSMIAAANVSSGISDLLGEIKMKEEFLQISEINEYVSPNRGADVIAAAFQKSRDSLEQDSLSFNESVFSQEEIDGLRREALSIRRAIADLKEEAIAKNFSVKIDLPENVEAVISRHFG